MTGVVGYCRTSQHRDNGYSLEWQTDEIHKWASRGGIRIVRIAHDDGVSGLSSPPTRRGFSTVLAALRAGEAGALVISRFDRLTRSLTDFTDILGLSRVEEWGIICVDPPLDTRTPSGRTTAATLIAFAGIEVDAFRDRMQGGRRAKIARGGYGGGPRLHRRYGFTLVSEEDGWIYEPVAAEQEIIGRIRDMRSAGDTLTAISRTLEGAGIASPSGGRNWYSTTIKRLAT